jgi:acyl carrier protein
MDIEGYLAKTMRRIFKDDSLEITRDLTAEAVRSWDSLSHVQLILEIEKEFSIRFRTAEIGKLQNVGDLIDTIYAKRA